MLLTGRPPEDLPHRGLGIDVPAALQGRSVPPALVTALGRMLEPDPDRRATSIRPLLRGLDVSEQRHRGPPPGATTSPPHATGRERPPDLESVDFGEPAEHASLPPFVPLALRFGLLVARLAIALALGFAVPALLALLSLVFGAGLRRAAHSVRRVGVRAGDALALASDGLASSPRRRHTRRRSRRYGRRRRRSAKGPRAPQRVRASTDGVDDGDVRDEAAWAEAEDDASWEDDDHRSTRLK
jgi:hypothetical protein